MRAMSRIYLPSNASAARLREAEHARRNRAGIVRELSWGRVTRRDLIKMGLFTAAGLLAPIGGPNPFVKSAYGQAPTGLPPRGWLRPDRRPSARADLGASAIHQVPATDCRRSLAAPG